MLHAFARELRYAVRSLRREPTFVLGVVTTFALAIGTNAAMFGLVTRLMLAPPPGIRAPEHVARLQFQHAQQDGETYVMTTTSYPVYRALAGATRAFASVAAERTDTVYVGRGAELQQASVVQASGNYFGVLGAVPALGRLFSASDDELPRGSSVVVLSHAYWRNKLGGDRAAIGRELVVDGDALTIIGVASAGFNGDGLSPVDLFVPLTTAQRGKSDAWITNDGMNVAAVIARLAPAATTAIAAQAATAILRDHDTRGDDASRTTALLEPIVPEASARRTAQSRIALWLSGVSLIVLLIATANVGTLLLLRAARRQKDLAVRLALGAGHGDIARQLGIESLLLAMGGAVVGLVLSRWFGTLLRVTLLPTVAAGESLVEQRVLVVSIVVALIAGLLAGASPILHVRRRDLALDLRAGGAGLSSRSTMRNALVAVQVALCTLLLVGAGLFVRSLERVQSQDLGFSTKGLLFVELDFRGFHPGPERDAAHEEALRRVRALAGVTRASVVQAMPFGSFHVPPIAVPGTSEPPSVGGQMPMMYGATPDYLAMMGTKLVQGRLIGPGDVRTSPLVLLVNETFARIAWPGQSALGKCVKAGFGPGTFPPDPDGPNPAESAPCREVIGVVRDSRVRSIRTEGNEARLMQYYVPFEQLPIIPVPDRAEINGLLVQTTRPLDLEASVVQRSIQSGSTLPVYARVRPYQDLIDPQLRTWRLGATLFSLFGALALAIAAVGLFGVVSYLVEQRTREIGVRLALGAPRALVWRLIVGDAVRLVLVGLAVGGVGAMAAAPLVREMLFHTSPWEPSNLAGAIAILLGVTVVAAIRPAWRAGRVDPLVALRAEA